ncbi:hypothetical protein LMG26857_03750 [Achromobacter anxifer]|uniref:methyltransferase domain-containing protein n=1 Tax=Achromobacter anxifer TaxID=1287737 RepID=UPI00155D4B76|nr:methyltransferase domain-containing protein [Achromobacter anxifer]CAB5514691.1 hypothetical protein LMG26857_03750 [Achromobacter anxifer]
MANGAANLEAMDAAATYQAAMTSLLIRSMGLARGTVLDYGAGTGAYARAVARAQPQWCVQALEPNRLLHSHFCSETTVFSGLAHIQPSSLDGAFSLNVFEHIVEDVQVLANLAARCKPGAPIFILVPAHMGLWSPMDDLVGHVRRYSLRELEQLGQAAGLRVTGSGWFDGTGYLATKAYQIAMRAGLLSKTDGTISTTQVAAFDRVFALCEPLIRGLRLPLGKNCWVRLVA